MGKLTGKLLLVLSCSSALSVCLTSCLLNNPWDVLQNHSLGLLAWLMLVSATFLSLLLSILTLDIIRQYPANSHTLTTLLSQYWEHCIFSTLGYIAHRLYMPNLKDCKKAQSRTLLNILSKNAKSEHGRKIGFLDIKTRDEYVARHPLVDYEYYRGYVDRLCNGERYLLSSEDVAFWGVTSGTTGKSKLFPIMEGDRGRMIVPLLKMTWSWSKYTNLKRLMDLRTYSPERKTPGGLGIGNASGFYRRPRGYDVTPPCCHRIYQEQQAFHVQGLFFLAEKEVGAIQSMTPFLLYSFFKFLEHNVDLLCDDIAVGKVSNEVQLPDDIRQEVDQHLVADPQRAEAVRQAIKMGWTGMAKRLWPHAGYLIIAMKTGGLAHCAKLLDDSYTADIPQLGFLHPASEGFIGLVVEDDWSVETFSPNLTTIFFEFIPEENMADENPATVFMDQVEVGKCYELVLTTYAGLYRYRLGDVVRIAYFMHGTPQYEFLYRAGQLLNCGFERTPESTVYEALNKLQDDCPDIKVEDYTCTESVVLERMTGEVSPTHMSKYVIFVELQGDQHLNEHHEARMDALLCTGHEPYALVRQRGRLAPLQFAQVATGTFIGLRTLLMGDTLNQQFKMPRVLRKEHALKYLMGKRLH